jgi:ribosomal protein S18 acetylase RimI-like enzyme
VTNLHRVELDYSQAGAALAALGEWIPAGPLTSPLHPGDIGWALRFEETVVHLWLDGDEPVAVSFDDGDVSRVTLAPGFDGVALEPYLKQWCDGIEALAGPGWQVDDGPWIHLSTALEPTARTVADLSEEDVADRVAVQRSAFERSTFTVERWKTMRDSPAGSRCVEVLIRTPEGVPASAVTGWLAGPGRCALIEPMGTHPSQRGRGYGRQALLAIGEALASRGASAVSVFTPASNTAAVALYRSAGFAVVGETRALRRVG